MTGLRERAEPIGVGGHTRIDQIITFTLVCATERPEVFMRAESFTGPLHDGDLVSIPVAPQRRPGATIQTVVLRNLTRQTDFGPPRGRRLSGWVLPVAALLVVGAIAVFAVLVAR